MLILWRDFKVNATLTTSTGIEGIFLSPTGSVVSPLEAGRGCPRSRDDGCLHACRSRNTGSKTQ